jgi:nucleoside-diphosphate-sugar epimerase
MLKQQLAGRNVAIIGYQTATARIILRKIIRHCHPLPNILAIEIGKEPQKRSKFIADPYFSPEERAILTSKVKFVPLGVIHEEMQKWENKAIDILFTLLEPIDFSNMDKVIDYHLVGTSKIVDELEKMTIRRVIHLSSIYGREPGYVSEEDELDIPQSRHKFTKRDEALSYLKDNFGTDVEGWRWSIEFIEKSYSRVA